MTSSMLTSADDGRGVGEVMKTQRVSGYISAGVVLCPVESRSDLRIAASKGGKNQ